MTLSSRRQIKILLEKINGIVQRKQSYTCPICSYQGPFSSLRQSGELRVDARCPACRGLERHRLQQLVTGELFTGTMQRSATMLHFAPEPIFRERFQHSFADYVCADITIPGVDVHLDMQKLPFKDSSFDVIYASHVLEHIQEDHRAMREIHRILRPSGVALLPVPITGEHTEEYPAPRPDEHYHVRSPGLDYFDRMRAVFDDVAIHTSADYDSEYQLFGLVMSGNSIEKIADYVPVCRKWAD